MGTVRISELLSIPCLKQSELPRKFLKQFPILLEYDKRNRFKVVEAAYDLVAPELRVLFDIDRRVSDSPTRIRQERPGNAVN
jgi:hypothetical protein